MLDGEVEEGLRGRVTEMGARSDAAPLAKLRRSVIRKRRLPVTKLCHLIQPLYAASFK